MVKTLASRLFCMTLIGCLAIAFSCASQPASAADDKAPEKKTEKKVKKDKSKKEKVKPGHRLPSYYKDVVSDEQRDKIYEIQDQYDPKIKELRRQLSALEKEQSDKIEAVLTPGQKEKIDAARAEAKAKRKAARNKSKKTAADKPKTADDKPK